MTFNKLVEEIKSLPLDLKEELKTLLERYLAEERRADFLPSNFIRFFIPDLIRDPVFIRDAETSSA
jgi:hypothetical protein